MGPGFLGCLRNVRSEEYWDGEDLVQARSRGGLRCWASSGCPVVWDNHVAWARVDTWASLERRPHKVRADQVECLWEPEPIKTRKKASLFVVLWEMLPGRTTPCELHTRRNDRHPLSDLPAAAEESGGANTPLNA